MWGLAVHLGLEEQTGWKLTPTVSSGIVQSLWKMGSGGWSGNPFYRGLVRLTNRNCLPFGGVSSIMGLGMHFL